jgi:ribosomal protein S16
MLTKTRVDPATRYRSPAVEGYCSQTSVRAGESIDIMLSAQPAANVQIDIYRLGYYQGHGARHRLSLGPFAVQPQADPPVGTNRVRDADWTPTSTLHVPDDWTTGVYLGKLTADGEGLQSYIIFIVKDDRPVDFLFQCSDNTWNAYNRWPSQFALYDNGQKEWYWGPDVATSFNRPFGKYCQIFDAPLSTGSGEFLLWEFPLAFWMEREGYDLSYISNVDTHMGGDALRRGRVFLSVGHDEYWSEAMFHNARGLVESGVNVAFFSGNTCYGLVDYHPDAQGRPNRIIERVGIFSPAQKETAASYPEILGLDQRELDESTLIGARSTHPVTGGADWICADEKHWLFEGTDMKTGEGIPGLVGWEWHARPANIPGLKIVAEGKTTNGSIDGHYTATIYTGPKGNLVFNASTIWWGDALSEPPGYVRPAVYTKPQGPDPRAQQITRNLFREMLRRGLPSNT